MFKGNCYFWLPGPIVIFMQGHKCTYQCCGSLCHSVSRALDCCAQCQGSKPRSSSSCGEISEGDCFEKILCMWTFSRCVDSHSFTFGMMHAGRVSVPVTQIILKDINMRIFVACVIECMNVCLHRLNADHYKCCWSISYICSEIKDYFLLPTMIYQPYCFHA